MVAPDQVTFDYLKGRPLAPKGEDWDRAVAYWKVRTIKLGPIDLLTDPSFYTDPQVGRGSAL